MTGTGKGWRVRLKNRVAGLLDFLIWLLSIMERDKRIYLSLRDIEHSSLTFSLMAYHEAAERVVKFPRHGNALEAIERIEAEMKRRDGLERARWEAERLERDAVYEELQRRDELREQKWRNWHPKKLTRWSGVLQAWENAAWCSRLCRSPPKPR
jgi:hypothetical protein